jgi:4-methyl-5(b-hydroxyethyl)-thiazole monophosphate biosynthesis
MTVAVLFAAGFEEIEAITIVDVLRRAEFDVLMTGVGGTSVTGANGITVSMDRAIGDLSIADLDAVVLPGGIPGSENLAESAAVRELLQAATAADKHVGAICAAPIALGAAGLSAGRRLTCYPGFEDRVTGGTMTGTRVAIDGKLITGKGPGAALDFSLALVAEFGQPETAAALREGMLVG